MGRISKTALREKRSCRERHCGVHGVSPGICRRCWKRRKFYPCLLTEKGGSSTKGCYGLEKGWRRRQGHRSFLCLFRKRLESFRRHFRPETAGSRCVMMFEKTGSLQYGGHQLQTAAPGGSDTFCVRAVDFWLRPGQTERFFSRRQGCGPRRGSSGVTSGPYAKASRFKREAFVCWNLW